MAMIDPMIQELQYEAGTTRTLLERLPEAAWDWKPHEKSMSLGQLASHIAESVGWTRETMEKDVLDMSMDTYSPYLAESRETLLADFDKNLKDALDAMDGTPDDRMMASWKMVWDGKPVLEMPRIAVLRGFILSHMIHHRGQLTVYARMQGAPLPAIYGPSADDAAM